MSFHIGLCMIASITFVVQFSPWQKLYSGCSDSSNRGVIHVTGGSRPAADVLDDVVDREHVLLPRPRVLAVAADRRVRRPDVALLVLVRRVVRPRDARRGSAGRPRSGSRSTGGTFFAIALGVVRPRRAAPAGASQPNVFEPWRRGSSRRRGLSCAPPDCAAIVYRWFGNDGPCALAKKLSNSTFVRRPVPVVRELVLGGAACRPTGRPASPLVEPVHLRRRSTRRARTRSSAGCRSWSRSIGAARERPLDAMVHPGGRAVRPGERAEQVVEACGSP